MFANYKCFAYTIAILLLTTACRQSARQAVSVADTPTAVTSHASEHLTESFTEDFSGTFKGSYEAGTITAASGTWLLEDALIGRSERDAADGKPAVRIRYQGRLAMQFDVPQAHQVKVGYAVYGNDAPADWQLWIAEAGVSGLKQTGNTITAKDNNIQYAVFPVQAKGAVRFEIRKTSGSNSRLLITSVAISTAGSSADSSAASPAESIAGGEDGHLLMGNPTGAVRSINSPDNYLVDHGYYVISYSKSRAIPNWVSWHTGAADLGNAKRTDNFRPNNSLPTGWYKPDADSYKGSGFDKGHNCPSGDRTASLVANASTFFMDNMIPQAPHNNQHTWEHLESHCRDLIKKGHEIYVVMGNYGSGGTGSNGFARTIDNGRINVPARIWKVVVVLPQGSNDIARVEANTQVIAIDTPNDNDISRNWMDYLTTVDDIEKNCKCDLLSALPDGIEQQVEKKKYNGSK